MVTDAHVLPRESKWTGSVDSKGFRLLKRQVLDLQECTQDEVVSLLKDSMVYEDGIFIYEICNILFLLTNVVNQFCTFADI